MGEVILINCTYWVDYHDHPIFLKIPVKHKNCKLSLQIIQFKIKESLLKKKPVFSNSLQGWTCLQDRNRLVDLENKFRVTEGKDEGRDRLEV